MLFPLVEFANTEYTTCFTAYSDSSQSADSENRFHPALQNTLLGVRLYCSDFVSDFDYMPTYDGRTLLGYLEPEYDQEIQQSMMLNSYLLESGVRQYQEYTSYYDSRLFNELQLWQNENSEMLDELTETERTGIINLKQVLLLSEDSTTNYIFGDVEEPVCLIRRGRSFRLTGQPYYLFTVGPSICHDENNGFKEISSLTEWSRINRSLFQKANPYVYEASTIVMRYAALFRHVKQYHPAKWKKFYEGILSAKKEALQKYPELLERGLENKRS